MKALAYQPGEVSVYTRFKKIGATVSSMDVCQGCTHSDEQRQHPKTSGGALRDGRCRRGGSSLLTGTGPEACSSQESCAGLLAGLMTLMHVSYRVPCDPVMHR